MTDKLLTTTQKTQAWQDISVELLNDIFTPLTFQERISLLEKYFGTDDVLFTSSFGTNSVFLLYWMSELRPDQKVHFIDTGYNFPETLAYKEDLSKRFDLNIVEVHPDAEQHAFTRDEQWWKDHPRMCCSINKIVPLEPIKSEHKVWVSGIMGYQTDFRSGLRVFERQGDIIKFQPLIDIDEGEVNYYFSLFNLPDHPLKAQGYGSVGCTHCTAKGEGREGRWKGQHKTECGLHPSYFINKKKEKAGV